MLLLLVYVVVCLFILLFVCLCCCLFVYTGITDSADWELLTLCLTHSLRTLNGLGIISENVSCWRDSSELSSCL